MKTAPVVAVLVVGSFFAGALVRGCQRNAEADEAIEQAEAWKATTALRDAEIVRLAASVAVVDSIAADSTRQAREQANEAQRDARAARSQAGRVVAQLEGMIDDTARALLDSIGVLHAQVSEAQERETAACRLELRQCETRVAVRDSALLTFPPAIASRDSTIAAQERAIDALRRPGLNLFGVPLGCTVGGAVAVGAGGAAAGAGIACGLRIGG